MTKARNPKFEGRAIDRSFSFCIRRSCSLMVLELRTRTAGFCCGAAVLPLSGRRRVHPSVRSRTNRRFFAPRTVRIGALAFARRPHAREEFSLCAAPTGAHDPSRPSQMHVPSISQQEYGATTSPCVLASCRSTAANHHFPSWWFARGKLRTTATPRFKAGAGVIRRGSGLVGASRRLTTAKFGVGMWPSSLSA